MRIHDSSRASSHPMNPSVQWSFLGEELSRGEVALPALWISSQDGSYPDLMGNTSRLDHRMDAL
jgi:hypothetical protein